MSNALLEKVVLPAAIGLRFIDAYSGMPVADGLHCRLYRRRDKRELGDGVATPSGVVHWPDLAEHWHDALPAPASSRAEVLVEDLLERFLPVRLPWPPAPDHPGTALATVTLASAPQRSAPSGAATVHAMLATEPGMPAAWARVIATDAQANVTAGMSDAAGRLTLHLPFPRPERKAITSPPDSPPSVPTISATVTLRIFHDPAVGAEALAASAPFLPGWIDQPEVRALARIGATDTFGPLRLEPDRPSVPVTEGLPPNRSELRLAPL